MSTSPLQPTQPGRPTLSLFDPHAESQSQPGTADRGGETAPLPPQLSPPQGSTPWPAAPQAAWRPPPDPRASWTLLEVFERLKLPEIKDRRQTTIAEYYCHLRRWADFWATRERITYPALAPEPRTEGPPGTEGPAVSAITRDDLTTFRGWLAEQKTRGRRWSDRTIKKHLGTVHAILLCAQDHQLIGTLPKLRGGGGSKPARKLYLLRDEVSALYLETRTARWPADLYHPPRVYWQCLLVLWWNYGPRTQELVQLKPDFDALRIRNVWWQRDNPSPEGRASNEWGWLFYTPQKQRRTKPEPLYLPMNETIHRHLRALVEPDASGDAPLFPFPHSHDAFYGQWRKLCRAAGVRPKPDPSTGDAPEFTPKHFRKTAATWLNLHRPGIAQWITGHGDDRSASAQVAVRGSGESGVLARHYDNAENALIEALTTYEQPAAFAEGPTLDVRQKRLF
ncbi:MAG: site-specific integrase [Planctomycetes bacterium]|nr:site-specific integrase [Planctomycetota bacterium]